MATRTTRPRRNSAPARAEERIAGHRPARAILVVMSVGYFLVLLDVTIVNIGLPQIGSGLHAGVSSLQWVVDGYALALAGLVAIAGAVAGTPDGGDGFLTGFHAVALGSGMAYLIAAAVGAAVIPGRRSQPGTGRTGHSG